MQARKNYLPERLLGREPLYGLFCDARIDHAVLRDFTFDHLEGIRPKILLRHDRGERQADTGPFAPHRRREYPANPGDASPAGREGAGRTA